MTNSVLVGHEDDWLKRRVRSLPGVQKCVDIDFLERELLVPM